MCEKQKNLFFIKQDISLYLIFFFYSHFFNSYSVALAFFLLRQILKNIDMPRQNPWHLSTAEVNFECWFLTVTITLTLVRKCITAKTSWSSLGNLHKPSYKTNTYSKIRTINAWNNSQKLLKISLRYLSSNKSKKNSVRCQFGKYWNELSTFRYIFQIYAWWFFKFCKLYICFIFFSLLLLFYNIHFPIWSSFVILN